MVDWNINFSKTANYNSFEFPLIHKCDDFENLLLIIQNGFRFSYSKEEFSDSKRTISAYFPMISFSDLNYDKAITFLDSYGVFGVGMKKEWAQKNGLTPVLYFEKNSNIAATIISNFDLLTNVSYEDSIKSIQNRLVGIKHKFYKFIIEIAALSKNFYAPLYRKEILKNSDYSFGMEREWRVILDNDEVPRYITKNLYDQEEISKANNHFLSFEFKDIEYFLIEQDYQETKIKKALKLKFNITDEAVNKIKFHYNYSRIEYED